MKFATSYFYQVRNMSPNMIPISTAIWQPKWWKFHFDKNNIVNGLICAELAPGDECEGLCGGPARCEGDPSQCEALRAYRRKIKRCVRKSDFLKRCEDIIEKVRAVNHFKGEPIIVLMVYEKPDNPCSERAAIQELIQSFGYECKELKLWN